MTRVAFVVISLWAASAVAQSGPASIYYGDGQRYRSDDSISKPAADPWSNPAGSNGSDSRWQDGGTSPAWQTETWRWRGQEQAAPPAVGPSVQMPGSPWDTRPAGSEYGDETRVLPGPYEAAPFPQTPQNGQDFRGYRFRGDPGLTPQRGPPGASGQESFRFRPLEGDARSAPQNEQGGWKWRGEKGGSTGNRPGDLYDSMTGRNAPSGPYPPPWRRGQ